MTEQTLKLYTVADLAALPDDGLRYELDEGELIAMPPPTRQHGYLVMLIGRLLGNYVEEHDLGEVVAEAGYLLAESPDTVRSPDVSFTAKARVQPFTPGYDRTPPDLAVEVVLPGNSAADLNKKVIQYFGAGVRLVWLIYPLTKTVHVYTGATAVTILDETAILTGGDVLPGLVIPISRLFSR